MPSGYRSQAVNGRSFYVVLDLNPDATLTEIRSAYRRKALQAHPDKGGSKESFQEVVRAFETLCSVRERRKYDEWLRRGGGIHCLDSDHQKFKNKRQRTQIDSSPSAFPGTSRTGAERSPDTSKNYSLDFALFRLRRQIALIPGAHRQEAINSINMKVRQSLLAFMELHRSQYASHHNTSQPSDLRSPSYTDSRECVPEGFSKCDSGTSSSESSVAYAIDDLYVDAQSLQAPASIEHPRAQCANDSCDGHQHLHLHPGSNTFGEKHTARNKAGTRGVVTLANGKYRTMCLMLDIGAVGRCVRTCVEAVQMHAILISVKDMVIGAEKEAAHNLELRIQNALSSVCHEFGMLPDDLSLLYKVEFKVSAMIGRQHRIMSRYSDKLANVVQQRERVLAAKQMGWSSLRCVWIDFMQLGPSAQKCFGGRGRDPAKTAEEAAEIADAAYNTQQARCARFLRKRVQRTAQVVERLLDAVDRKAAIKDRQRRDVRLRWLRDPSRTTAELLRGPPI